MNELPLFVGRFPILDLLGLGGMGIVYLAEDPDIGRKVAIKVLHASQNSLALERFKNEARTIGELSHPNIVMLLEYGIEDNRPYLVMEYLPGISLEEWIKKPHTLVGHIKVLVSLCRALEYAHEKQILHRDLKLGNVQVLPNGDSKLLDFGIARSQDAHLTTTGFFVGTPKYLAPEILSNSDHSKASDCYSLGLVAYTAFSNRDPYDAPTFEGIVARKLTQTPEPLHRINPLISEKISATISSYLVRDPEQRPQTPEKLKNTLLEIKNQTELEQLIDYVDLQAESASNSAADSDVTLIADRSSVNGLKDYRYIFLTILAVLLSYYLFLPNKNIDSLPLNEPATIAINKDSKPQTSAQQEQLSESRNAISNTDRTEKKKALQKKQPALANTATSENENNADKNNTLRSDKKPSIKIETLQQNSLSNKIKITSGQPDAKQDIINAGKSRKSSETGVKTQVPKETEIVTYPLHKVLPSLLLNPINRKSKRVIIKLISTTSLARGKTVKLKLNTSKNITLEYFRFFRGRKEFNQISILKLENLAARELILHLYIDPNTKLGEYSLVGYYKNRKTNAISIEVTL